MRRLPNARPGLSLESASASDSARVISTSRPPASMNRIAASIFGPHAARRKLPLGEQLLGLATRDLRQRRAAVGFPKSRETRSTPVRTMKRSACSDGGEHRRRVVLVDHGLDARGSRPRSVDDDRHAAAAGRDDDVPAVDERGDDFDAADRDGAWARRPPCASRGRSPRPWSSRVSSMSSRRLLASRRTVRSASTACRTRDRRRRPGPASRS